MPAGKEAETADTYDEDEYRDKLISDGYSESSAKMLAAKKKESLSVKKIEIDLGSLAKADEFEHLSPEERKKRKDQRAKRQKDRAKHRKDRQKQHEAIEAGIPEGE